MTKCIPTVFLFSFIITNMYAFDKILITMFRTQLTIVKDFSLKITYICCIIFARYIDMLCNVSCIFVSSIVSKRNVSDPSFFFS